MGWYFVFLIALVFYDMAGLIMRGAEGNNIDGLDKACQVIGLPDWESYDIEQAITSP